MSNRFTDQERGTAEKSVGTVSATQQPSASPEPTPNDVEVTLKKVLDLIRAAERAGYVYAADNLKHYIYGKGHPKVMPASAIQDQKFVVGHLRDNHLPRIIRGVGERLRDGRLAVSKDSVYISWENAIEAPEATDLFFALGGWTIKSKTIVRAIEATEDEGVLVRFERWVVSSTDTYDWDAGKATFVQLFGVIEDKKMARLQALGYAKSYPIKIQSFDALKILGVEEFHVLP